MILSFFSTLRGCVLAAAVCVLSGSLSVSGAWGVPLCHGGRFSGLSFVDFHAGGASVLGPRDRREEENQLRGSGQGLGTLEGGGVWWAVGAGTSVCGVRYRVAVLCDLRAVRSGRTGGGGELQWALLWGSLTRLSSLGCCVGPYRAGPLPVFTVSAAPSRRGRPSPHRSASSWD